MVTTTFEDAYGRYYPSIVRSAWSICRDLAQAEELAQEAFVRAYRRWSRLDRGGYAEPWLHRVVMNLALSSVQRNHRGRTLEAFDRVGYAAPVGMEQQWVITTLRRLPTRQREAVFLTVVADLPEDRVAALMGVSAGSVKVHKSRGLARLRTLLDPTDGERHGAGRNPAPATDR